MKHKKTILVFIDWFLPGFKAGGPITSCANFIEQLKHEYHFKVITRDRDYMSHEPYDLESDQWVRKEDGVFIYYLSPKKITYKNLKKLISNTDHDLVYINGMFSWYFSILPLFLVKKRSKIVAPRGMLRPSALRVKRFKKFLFLKLVKLIGLHRNSVFHATTEEESRDIQNHFRKNTIRIARNFPKPFELNTLNPKTKEKGSLKICFPGRVAREKNLKFALEVVSELKGDIQLQIAGELYDSEYWRECEPLIHEMPENISTRMLGSLSPDLFKNELEQADISLLPTLGENFGHAIIESLSLGAPVLISDQTPWRNLKSRKAGIDISLDSKDKFVSSLQDFCDMETTEFNEWRKSARQYAAEQINWEHSKEQYRDLFNV